MLARIVIDSGVPLLEVAAGGNTESTNLHGGVTDELGVSQGLFEDRYDSTVGAVVPLEIGRAEAHGYNYLTDAFGGLVQMFSALSVTEFNGGEEDHAADASTHARQSITLRVEPSTPEELGLPVRVALGASRSHQLGAYSRTGSSGLLSRVEYVVPSKSFTPTVLSNVSTTQGPSATNDTEEHLTLLVVEDRADIDLTVGETFVVSLEMGQSLNGAIAPTIYPMGHPLEGLGYSIEDSFSVYLTARIASEVRLAANHDDEPATDRFGPYLVGAPLTTTFTALLTGEARDAATVALTVPGHGAFVATPQNGIATFSVPLGTGAIAAGEHQMLVRAVRADGSEIVRHEPTILFAEADLELQARYPDGQGQDSWHDIEQLRFLDGIALTTDFRGTISPIASYYADKIDTLMLGDVTQTISLVDAGDRKYGFEFTRDADVLDKDDTKARVVYKPTGKAIGDHEPLTMIELPSWMGTPLSKGFDPNVVVLAGPATGAYVVKLAYPPALQFDGLRDLQPSDLGPFGLLLGGPLKNDVGLGLHLTVYARPTVGADDVKVVAEDAFVEVTLLDQSLLDASQPIASSDVRVEAKLKPKTLEAIGTIKVTTTSIDLRSLIPGKPAFDLPFGLGGPNTWTVPLPGAGIFGLTAGVAFSGQLLGELHSLTGSLGVELDVSGPTPVLVAGGTYVNIAGAAYATIEATAQGGLGLTIIPIGFTLPVGTVAIEGNVGAVMVANVQVNFSGAPSRPSAWFNAASSFVQLVPWYSVAYDYAWFSTNVNPSTSGKTTQGSYPIQILGNPGPTQASLNQPSGLSLSGAGSTSSSGYPGAQPTGGGTAVQLGTTGPPPPAPGVQALSVAPSVSKVKVLVPLDTGARSIAFDLNALADSAGLTAGAHWLEAALVSVDGQDEVPLGRIDLASLPLAVNDNPLGHSSGWTRIAWDLPSAGLRLGQPYQLEYRFQTDGDTTGERVAVLLDGLDLEERAPRAALSSPVGDVADGVLLFGTDTADPNLGILRLANEGDDWLNVGPIELVGSGFALEGVLGDRFEVAPGDVVELKVRHQAPASPGARLVLPTNDPTRPAIEMRLASNGTPSNQAPSVGAIGNQAVNEGEALVVAVSATDPDVGDTLRYQLDVAPSGMTIDPATGIIRWTPAGAHGPGTHDVRVRVTDTGDPPLSALASFQVNVVNLGPTVQLNAPPTVLTVGQRLACVGSYLDVDAAGFTATVDHGDGTGAQSLPLGPGRTFSLGHAYATPGTYTTTVRVRDGDGGEGVARFSVTVTAAPIVRDTTGPRVVGLVRPRWFWPNSRLTIAFDEALDRLQAENTSRYKLRTAGRDRRFGTADDGVVPIKQATLSPSGMRVRLTLSRRLAPLGTYRLVLSGTNPNAITDTAGNPLDGDRDGRPGGNYVRSFRGFQLRPGFWAPMVGRGRTW